MMSEAARYMIAHGTKGPMINITSTRGERAYPSDGLYGGLGRRAQPRHSILRAGRVPVRHPHQQHRAGRDPRTHQRGADRAGIPKWEIFWDELGTRIPLGRSGLPEDIGNLVVFLASEKASYITGMTIRVDGGLILPACPSWSPRI